MFVVASVGRTCTKDHRTYEARLGSSILTKPVVRQRPSCRIKVIQPLQSKSRSFQSLSHGKAIRLDRVFLEVNNHARLFDAVTVRVHWSLAQDIHLRLYPLRR